MCVATHDEFRHHHCAAQQKDEEEVDEQEGPAAIFATDIGETPYVAQAYGRAYGGKYGSEIGRKGIVVG